MYRITNVKMLVSYEVDVLLGTTSADTFWDLVLYVTQIGWRFFGCLSSRKS